LYLRLADLQGAVDAVAQRAASHDRLIASLQSEHTAPIQPHVTREHVAASDTRPDVSEAVRAQFAALQEHVDFIRTQILRLNSALGAIAANRAEDAAMLAGHCSATQSMREHLAALDARVSASQQVPSFSQEAAQAPLLTRLAELESSMLTQRHENDHRIAALESRLTSLQRLLPLSDRPPLAPAPARLVGADTGRESSSLPPSPNILVQAALPSRADLASNVTGTPVCISPSETLAQLGQQQEQQQPQWRGSSSAPGQQEQDRTVVMLGATRAAPTSAASGDTAATVRPSVLLAPSLATSLAGPQLLGLPEQLALPPPRSFSGAKQRTPASPAVRPQQPTGSTATTCVCATCGAGISANPPPRFCVKCGAALAAVLEAPVQ
jgi:hypothetical protein